MESAALLYGLSARAESAAGTFSPIKENDNMSNYFILQAIATSMLAVLQVVQQLSPFERISF